MKRKNLKKFKIDMGLNSKEMAEKLGITLTHYSLIENGKREPSYKLLEHFEETFKNQYEDVWEIFKKEV